jgi:hypothetical protein
VLVSQSLEANKENIKDGRQKPAPTLDTKQVLAPQEETRRRSSRIHKRKFKLTTESEEEDTQDEAPSLLLHLFKSSRETTPRTRRSSTVITPSPTGKNIRFSPRSKRVKA